MDKKKYSAEDSMEQKLYAIAEELMKYLEKHADEAKLCHNEALRALARFAETEELTFRINKEEMDVGKFLRTLNKILSFDTPTIGLRSMWDLPSKRVPYIVEKIDKLQQHLSAIPGARKVEMPEIYRKIEIKSVVVVRD